MGSKKCDFFEHLEIFVWKINAPKEVLNEIRKIAHKFRRSIRTFVANLDGFFPYHSIPCSKTGQEISKSGGGGGGGGGRGGTHEPF